MSLSLTVVAREVVWAQGKLLVEMTDETVQEYTCRIDPATIYPGKEADRVFLNKTHEQLVEQYRSINAIYSETHRPLGRYRPQLDGLSYGGDSIASRRGWNTYR